METPPFKAIVSRTDFDALYHEGRPPWEIGHPQPAFVELEESGAIQGTVLDVGCGTGENALFFAARAHTVWGVDSSKRAIERAQEKARNRDLNLVLLCANALDLPRLGRRFDTVIDSGLFHLFTDEERARYVECLRDVTQPGGRVFLLCFSELETRPEGPRRISQADLHETFRRGWQIESIRPARFEASLFPDGARAWLLAVRRQEES